MRRRKRRRIRKRDFVESMHMAPLLLTSLPQWFLQQIFFCSPPTHSLFLAFFFYSFFRGKLPIQHFLGPSIKHLWRWKQEQQSLEQTVVHFTEDTQHLHYFPMVLFFR